MNPIRWGILGTGSIAKQFATALVSLTDAELVAVGSRQRETAEAFGERFGIPRRHISYEALVNDSDVDAVYVATPHSFHCENTLLTLRAGKATLCEKPFSVTTAEAEAMVACARERGVFLMEAMWTRFFPLMGELRRLLKENAIGETHILTADFGFRAGVNPEGRLFKPALGGGALLDVGVYTVSLASMAFGTPNRVVSLANIGETDVDEQAAMILGHEGRQLSLLYTAIRTTTPQEAMILGSDGSIRIHSPWWKPSAMTLHRNGAAPQRLEFPYEGNGFQFEAMEVMNCLRAKKLESDIMPLDETLAVMGTLTEIRNRWE